MPPAAKQRRHLRIGLTGGIASGKSMVAGMFAGLGVPVIDTDHIAREVVEPGMPALDRIIARFGPELLQADGRLDRRRLRRLAFADAAHRRDLEAIMHPAIRDRTLALAEAQAADYPYLIIVVPLLVESGFDALVDRVLVVDCPENVQRDRLLARDLEEPAQAQRMMDAQSTRAERLAAADDRIDNGGTAESTRAQVEAIHRRYLELAGDSAGA